MCIQNSLVELQYYIAVYRCSIGASAMAGSQGDELPGQQADMHSNRGALSSLLCADVVVTDSGPEFVYQRQKVQSTAGSSHPVLRYVAEYQDLVGDVDTGQTGLPQQFPNASSSGGYAQGREAASMPLRPHGCCCTCGSAGSPLHM